MVRMIGPREVRKRVEKEAWGCCLLQRGVPLTSARATRLARELKWMRKGSNHAKTMLRTTELASRGNDYPYYYRIGLSGVARPAEEPTDDGAKRCRTGRSKALCFFPTNCCNAGEGAEQESGSGANRDFISKKGSDSQWSWRRSGWIVESKWPSNCGLPKSFFYHSWERGKKITLEYYPATFLARFFSDEGVGSAVDCAPQRKKVSIRSGVRIPRGTMV
ncbi:hypothetical protein ACOSQ4_028571 [Xanthoceras sorbifolium]